jgi:hypothetical protein
MEAQVAEKITNGAFTTSLSGWTNYGTYNFHASASKALAESVSQTESDQHKLRQYFSVSGTVSSAILNAHIYWDMVHKLNHGEADFYIYLRKPDGTMLQLADHSEEATVDKTGNEQIADDLDITAYFTAVGTYAIELWATVKSSWKMNGDEIDDYTTYAWFDDISLAVIERVFKTIVEGLGGGELTARASGLAALEVAGLEESISHVGGYQPGVDPKQTVSQRNKAGLHEFLHANVEGNATEGAGLAESLERTYTYRQRDLPDMPNKVGLDESLKARWKVGNVTYERDIMAQEDIWEDIDPVDTYWETV